MADIDNISEISYNFFIIKIMGNPIKFEIWGGEEEMGQ